MSLTGGGCSGYVSTSGGNAGGQPPSGSGPGGPAPGPTYEACKIELMPASPLSFEGLSAGPDASLKVRGVVTGVPSASYQWEWSVALADGSAVPFSMPIPGDNVIQFSLPSPGTYTIKAQLLADRYCRGERSAVVARTGARLRSFRFHVTPPYGYDLPTRDFVVQVIGGTPSGGNHLQLLPGTKVPLQVRLGETGAPVRAYVRMSDERGIVFEGQTGRPGQDLLAHVQEGMYETLIVPEGDEVAPLLLPPTPASELSVMMGTALTVDQGITVEGMVRDADGSPLPDSKVILRAGELTSTLGASDATGAFRVRVRPGQFSATVSPPVALGMLRAEFPIATGVTIAPAAKPAPTGAPNTAGTASPTAATPTPALGFRLQPFRSARLTLALSGAPDSLGPTARVVIESMAPIADVATLSIGGSSHALSARIHGELTPNADGTVVAPTLPRGRYKATIYPAGGAGAADAVTTVTDIDVGPGDVTVRAITLARKVTMRGTLMPGAEAAGIQVVALDMDSLLPLAFVKEAVAGGAWEMAVNPGRTYTLRALPQPGQRFARASFGRVSVAGDDVSVAARNMPDALLYTGTIIDPSLGGIQGALMQIYCLPGTPDCTDPNTPVAEAVTGELGLFQLMLPDPGVNPP
ncbi:MAG TPA: hypothetical protein VFH73_27270 [Polyangia bacterium]|nr:hypothetical protein [Polyangia bacterium]